VHELTLPHSATRSASFGHPHDAHQRAGRACSSRWIATDSMQLHHAAYAASCRHTPMTHAYTGASCSIALRPGHGLNSLTLTTATRAAGPRPNVIRPVDARVTGLFLTITPLNPTLPSCTHRSIASSSALASRASSFFSLRQSRAKWPRTPQLKHLPIDDFFDFCRACHSASVSMSWSSRHSPPA
jgi:hypothetical protein